MFEPIKKLGGRYGVSKTGDVISYRRIVDFGKTKRIVPETILKKRIDTRGYPIICVYINEKIKPLTIHRLVAEQYIPNPGKKPEVNHIDGNRANNNIENLEWVTTSENIKHSYDKLRRKRGMTGVVGVLNKRSCAVIKTDKMGNMFCFVSITEAAKHFNISKSAIVKYCKGKCIPLDESRWEYRALKSKKLK